MVCGGGEITSGYLGRLKSRAIFFFCLKENCCVNSRSGLFLRLIYRWNHSIFSSILFLRPRSSCMKVRLKVNGCVPQDFGPVRSGTSGYQDSDQLPGTTLVSWGQILASPLCQIFRSGHVRSHRSSQTAFPSRHTEDLVSTVWHPLWTR